MVTDVKKRRKKLFIVVVSLIVITIFSILLDLSWAAERSLSLREVWDVIIGNGTWGNDIIVKNFNG
ncbi:MAG: hypothetical protein FWC44_01435, partial [Methanomassiliicoccaceae archaeon]|nr:hypothetical protein [Methanomassiliicoccaceae archaeon]